jgi:hypothetical protein
VFWVVATGFFVGLTADFGADFWAESAGAFFADTALAPLFLVTAIEGLAGEFGFFLVAGSLFFGFSLFFSGDAFAIPYFYLQ